MKIRTNLPPEVHGFRYVVNSHFIELEDDKGNTIRLKAKSMLKGTCQLCGGSVLVESRIGSMRCPHCGGEVEWVWGKAQLSFVPEAESDFVSPPQLFEDPDT